MNEAAVTMLLEDVRKALTREILYHAQRSSLDEALASYILPNWEVAHPKLKILQEAIIRLKKSRDYRDAAIVGYISAQLVREGNVVPSSMSNEFSQELEWLSGRPYILSNGNPAPFFSDAPALFGLALAVRFAENKIVHDKFTKWLQDLLPKCCQRRSIEDWELCLLAAAEQTLGIDNTISFPENDISSAIRIILRDYNILSCNNIQLISTDEEKVLNALLSIDLNQLSAPQAIFMAAAYDWIRRSASVVVPGRATVMDVATVLQGIQSSLHRWTWEDKPKTRTSEARQWYVENEYHVQNLLWIILKPLFRDLEYEFYSEPMGQKRPRADLGIPSLRLIIEVKFMRSSTTPQNMISEIAEDVGLYLTPNFPYDTIIPFVWDNTPRPQEHEVMKQGILKMKGISDVIIISRPDFMTSAVNAGVE